MDEALAKERFAKAEALIEQETQEIEKQQAFIQKLREGGHETGKAERSLQMIERSLAALKHHRDILLEHLGLYEPGESGTNTSVFSGPPVKAHHSKGNAEPG